MQTVCRYLQRAVYMFISIIMTVTLLLTGSLYHFLFERYRVQISATLIFHVVVIPVGQCVGNPSNSAVAVSFHIPSGSPLPNLMSHRYII